MSNQCSRCLYTSAHPFGLTLIDGMCSGCFTHQEKDTLDWQQRRTMLDARIENVKRKQKARPYDCVVPVSGDAEDFYVLQHVITTLGLNPLVICVNDYFLNDIGWHNLHHMITFYDVDSMIFNPDLTVYKEMIRTTLRRCDHMLWPAIALKTAFPVHVALSRKIPMIIWGQHQAVEQVGKFSHSDAVTMSGWSRQQHDLMDISLEEQIGNGAQLNTKHINYYRYPESQALHKAGVEGIYLSNYLRWDPLAQNNAMTASGFQPERQLTTYDPYERAGSSVYYRIHDLLKLQRVGYRKVLDHLCRDIRHGYISRDEAEQLYAFYAEQPVEVKPFFDWLGMSDSAQQWFTDHRLQPIKHLIGATSSDTPALPVTLQNKLAAGRPSQASFIPFGKGI